MHICLNMAGGANWLGGAIYVQNLARAIYSLAEAERADLKLSLVTSPSNMKLVEPISYCADQIYVKERLYIKVCKELSERLTFLPPQTFNLFKLDFFYPTFAGAKAPYKWGAWIPDFQHLYFPDHFPKNELSQRDERHKKMAANAPVIVLSSAMAQADFNRLYPDAAPRSRLLTFVSYAEPRWFEPNPQLTQQAYQLSDRFFLISNQFWRHKNHAVVIEALGILKQRGIYPVIACTGKTSSDFDQFQYYQQLHERVQELGLEEQVKILGLIPRLDQIQLMRRCLAVIQPSLFEGWSTVIEDARALGKPLIASDFPVHLEQNPPHTQFFERTNAEQLASIMHESWTTLNPGPNSLQEATARERNAAAIVDYGKRFLHIAKDIAYGGN